MLTTSAKIFYPLQYVGDNLLRQVRYLASRSGVFLYFFGEGHFGLRQLQILKGTKAKGKGTKAKQNFFQGHGAIFTNMKMEAKHKHIGSYVSGCQNQSSTMKHNLKKACKIAPNICTRSAYCAHHSCTIGKLFCLYYSSLECET